MRTTPFLLAATAAAVVLAGAPPAAANGRYPKADQIVFSPSDPNLIIARTTYALLPSHDNGATWKYLCEDVVGLSATATQDPEIGLTQSNALIAGVDTPSPGLNVSNDVGCNWDCVGGPLAGQSIKDIVVRPDTPDTALAVMSALLPVDGGGGWQSQVFQSTDNGATWAKLGTPIDPMLKVETIDVSKTDPNRIYLSGEHIGPPRAAFLVVSKDAGQTWTSQSIGAFDSTLEDSVYIGAVDPTDADRVYVRSSGLLGGGQSRLYVTKDGGQTFTIAKSFTVPPPPHPSELTGQLLGFALSQDGSKVYIGTIGDGLFFAPRDSMVFTKTHDMWVYCLATRGNELWACSEQVSGFVVGMSTDDGKTFTTKLASVYELCGTADCSGGSGQTGCNSTVNGSQCMDGGALFGASYGTFCSYAIDINCGTCSPPDAGASADGGSGSSGGAPPHNNSSSSCGLSAPGAGGTAAFLASCALAAVAVYRRKRKA